MNKNQDSKPVVRCAIYTRKSTEEGLQQEFNSLDAQRESAEAYIKSQASEGWVCLSDKYDDGGFSGGNTDRPALKRLMADIEAGKIDCVVVYKVDRFSRSLLDFSKMMETLERHKVSFVSVTQLFSTANSMGRLMMNVLLSFAQFEREIISERTRDKMAAARRKGKYVGGAPILGYDLHPGKKLVVNEVEAEIVRQIFALYLKQGTMLPTIREMDRRGWTTKKWTTKAGKERGGHAFDKNRLHHLLTNVCYVGKIAYQKQTFTGEHAAIVDEKLFEKVQKALAKNFRCGSEGRPGRPDRLLRGLLVCAPCQRAMIHTYSCKGTKQYRFYVCNGAAKRGRATCPSKSVPAAEIERHVVEQIKAIGRDPAVVLETLTQARSQIDERLLALERERRVVTRELSQANDEVARLARTPHDEHGAATARLADLNDRIREAERRVTEIDSELAGLKSQVVDERDLRDALAKFDPIWEALSPTEQATLMRLLVERVEYDAAAGTVEISFKAAGLAALKDKAEEAA